MGSSSLIPVPSSQKQRPCRSRLSAPLSFNVRDERRDPGISEGPSEKPMLPDGAWTRRTQWRRIWCRRRGPASAPRSRTAKGSGEDRENRKGAHTRSPWVARRLHGAVPCVERGDVFDRRPPTRRAPGAGHRRQLDPRPPRVDRSQPPPLRGGARGVANVLSAPPRVGRRQRPRLHRASSCARTPRPHIGVRRRGRAPSEAPPTVAALTGGLGAVEHCARLPFCSVVCSLPAQR